MITLNRLAERCYQIALKRGKINIYTSRRAIINAISTEWRELSQAEKSKSNHLPKYSQQEEEAADVIITTLTFLQKIGCSDIERLIKDKIMFNEHRTD